MFRSLGLLAVALALAAIASIVLCPLPPRAMFTLPRLMVTALWYLPMPWLIAVAVFAIARRPEPGLAMTAWWFGPIAILHRTMPEWTFVAIALWTIHLTTALVTEPRGSDRPLALVFALSLQGIVLLLGTGQLTLAAALTIVPAAIAATGFAPLRLPWKRTLATLALLLLALIPMGSFLAQPMRSLGGGGRAMSKQDDRTDGQRSDSEKTKAEIHRGIILWPPAEKPMKPVPPRPARTRSQLAAQTLTLRIPFQGVYWFFQPPLAEPPPFSLTDHGVPTEKSYRATDRRNMVMEAHQHFVTRLPITCCRRIDLEITNADPLGQNTLLELVLHDTSDRNGAPMSLGMVPVQTRPQDNRVQWKAQPIPEVLSFRVPPDGYLSGFDSVTIRFHRPPFRKERSARIDIRAFVLVP